MIHWSRRSVPSIHSRIPSSPPIVNVYAPVAGRLRVRPERNPMSSARMPAIVPRNQLVSNISEGSSGRSASLVVKLESHQIRSQEPDGNEGGADGQGVRTVKV